MTVPKPTRPSSARYTPPPPACDASLPNLKSRDANLKSRDANLKSRDANLKSLMIMK